MSSNVIQCLVECLKRVIRCPILHKLICYNRLLLKFLNGSVKNTFFTLSKTDLFSARWSSQCCFKCLWALLTPPLSWSDEQTIDMSRLIPYSTAPDTLMCQASHIHHNNQWIVKDIQAYNLLLYKHDSKKVGTRYKLWIKTECNDVEVSNFYILFRIQHRWHIKCLNWENV